MGMKKPDHLQKSCQVSHQPQQRVLSLALVLFILVSLLKLTALPLWKNKHPHFSSVRLSCEFSTENERKYTECGRGDLNPSFKLGKASFSPVENVLIPREKLDEFLKLRKIEGNSKLWLYQIDIFLKKIS